MKSIVFLMMVGLLFGLAFATAVTYWFTVPQKPRSAWNPEFGGKGTNGTRPVLMGEEASR